jgi:hypothetical protein
MSFGGAPANVNGGLSSGGWAAAAIRETGSGAIRETGSGAIRETGSGAIRETGSGATTRDLFPRSA